MKKKTKNLALLITFSALLLSCSRYQFEALDPYQKKAEITLENNNYEKTNSDIFQITDKYNGFVKSAVTDTKKPPDKAEYNLNIPFANFYNFINAIHNNFPKDIKLENITDEESLTVLYKQVTNEIEDKEKYLYFLYRVNRKPDSPDDKVMAVHEIGKVEEQLQNLRKKKLSLLESMNYSSVNIKWTDADNKHKQHHHFEEKGECPERPHDADIPDFIVPPHHFPPLPKTRDLIFRKFGQEESFQLGEPVRIMLDGIEDDDADFISKIDYEDDNIVLKLVRKGEKGIIKLDSKCQIINVGSGPLPQILAGEKIRGQQIVITPIVDENCSVVGREIRAGSIESGCLKGRANLSKLRNCRKELGRR